MKVVLIGAGNLATHFGRALSDGGHEIVQVFSRTMEAAETLAKAIGGSPINDLSLLYSDADIYVVALKDSVVKELLPAICRGREKRLFIHTSGSLPMNVFCGYAEQYGVCYPLQTFSKFRNVDFQHVPCFIEGTSEHVLSTLKDLMSSVSHCVEMMPSDRRRKLHLAAVFACNFTNHCYALAENILKRENLPFDLLLPLIDETARKVHGTSPHLAQTGPAVRYDENIIDGHLALLEDDVDSHKVYEAMTESIFILHKSSYEADKMAATPDLI